MPTRSRTTPWALVEWAVVAGAFVAVVLPHWVIRPFRAQDPRDLAVALWVVRWSPSLTLAALGVSVAAAVVTWRPSSRGRRAVAALGCALAALCAVVARVNVYERMFHSIGAPAFVSIDASNLGPRDMVLAVRSAAAARAYPVRALTFHHIVNDVLGGAPIAVTYCSLCHTGIVWSRSVGGRILTFRIGGINNQNMLMRDEETGTFWQQSTGKAVSGPLAGLELSFARSDELSFAVWQQEAPSGVVLARVEADTGDYASAEWEDRMKLRPSVLPAAGPLAARDLVFGVERGNATRAFPAALVLEQPAFLEVIGDTQLVFLVAPDGQSVRAFEARPSPASEAVELFAKAGSPGAWLDSVTGSEWSFSGCAVSGSACGECLRPVPILRSYWFDWHEHHPTTTVAERRR